MKYLRLALAGLIVLPGFLVALPFFFLDAMNSIFEWAYNEIAQFRRERHDAMADARRKRPT